MGPPRVRACDTSHFIGFDPILWHEISKVIFLKNSDSITNVLHRIRALNLERAVRAWTATLAERTEPVRHPWLRGSISPGGKAKRWHGSTSTREWPCMALRMTTRKECGYNSNGIGSSAANAVDTMWTGLCCSTVAASYSNSGKSTVPIDLGLHVSNGRRRSLLILMHGSISALRVVMQRISLQQQRIPFNCIVCLIRGPVSGCSAKTIRKAWNGMDYYSLHVCSFWFLRSLCVI